MSDSARKRNIGGFIRVFLNDKVAISFLMVIALFIVGEIVVPGFVSFSHVMAVLQAAFFLGLLGLGQTIVVLSGKEGLDLSVGSTMTVGVLLGAAVIQGSLSISSPSAFSRAWTIFRVRSLPAAPKVCLLRLR